MQILSPQYHGRGVFAEIAHFMTVVSKILNNVRVWGGRAVVTESGIDIYIDESGTASGTFSGTAYVSGVRTTGLKATTAKPFVVCNLSTGAAAESYGPMPNPMPVNEEWFEKSKTYGDIHVARAG